MEAIRKRTRDDRRLLGPTTLNASFRKQEMLKIIRENQSLLKRLQTNKPKTTRSQWDRHALKHANYRKRITGIKTPEQLQLSLTTQRKRRLKYTEAAAIHFEESQAAKANTAPNTPLSNSAPPLTALGPTSPSTRRGARTSRPRTQASSRASARDRDRGRSFISSSTRSLRTPATARPSTQDGRQSMPRIRTATPKSVQPAGVLWEGAVELQGVAAAEVKLVGIAETGLVSVIAGVGEGENRREYTLSLPFKDSKLARDLVIDENVAPFLVRLTLENDSLELVPLVADLSHLTTRDQTDSAGKETRESRKNLRADFSSPEPSDDVSAPPDGLENFDELRRTLQTR
jgi:hypothetical protein